MARSFGRVKSSIWEAGSDWRGLEVGAQWLYLALISQPAISSVGVLDYAPHRWARFSSGLTREDVEGLAGELEAAWFVLVDRETEELLVRSFVKHDEPWKRPNNLAGARSALRAVESEDLRAYLGERHPWLEETGGGGGEEVAEHERANSGSNRGTDRSPNSGTNSGSDSGQDSGRHGVLLARGDKTRQDKTRKGRRLGLASATTPLDAPSPAQGDSDGLDVVANCPMCGELRNVPKGFSMVDHLEHVHGVLDGAAFLESHEVA